MGNQRAARSRRDPRIEEHGWMQELADAHGRERAVDHSRQDPPTGISADEAAAEIRDVLDSIGDTCPECLPQD
jgi:hypothetical protein